MKIDTNKKVTFPYDWATVEDNKTYGKVDVSKLKLYKPKGKTLKEVQEEVKDMSPANLAVMQYIHENPTCVPKEWKDYWLYFFGTSLRGRDGKWNVPYARWDGSRWRRDAPWLAGVWNSNYRVVLLETATSTLSSEPVESLNLSLETRVQALEEIIKHHNLGL